MCKCLDRELKYTDDSYTTSAIFLTQAWMETDCLQIKAGEGAGADSNTQKSIANFCLKNKHLGRDSVLYNVSIASKNIKHTRNLFLQNNYQQTAASSRILATEMEKNIERV